VRPSSPFVTREGFVPDGPPRANRFIPTRRDAEHFDVWARDPVRSSPAPRRSEVSRSLRTGASLTASLSGSRGPSVDFGPSQNVDHVPLGG
jgi:hypothetical protein